MQSRKGEFIFDATFNFGTESPFLNEQSQYIAAPFPPTDFFMLLDGTHFLILDGTDLLLL